MKKKILVGIAVLAIAAIAAFNVNLNMDQKNELSLLALVNVEALAQNEEGGSDFIYAIDKDPCTFNVTTDAQANFITKILGINAKVNAIADLTNATALYRLGGNYRLGTDLRCGDIVSQIISAAE